MNYLEWNNAIGKWFFNEEKAEQEVQLFISKHDLVKIGREKELDGDTEKIFLDFIEAIRKGIPGQSLNGNILEHALYAYNKWQESPAKIDGIPVEYPLYLGYLTIFVLPLIESNQPDLRVDAYYPRVRTFLKKYELPTMPTQNEYYNLKWHNKIGWITVAFLIITTITGMFLRPPLLIPIASSKVNKIPYTILDSENPWFDKLRRIIYDKTQDRYIIATLDGVYYSNDNFSSKLRKYKTQPPLSVMGVNVFEQINDSVLLVGSFEGLYKWNTGTGLVQNYISKQEYKKTKRRSSPIGSNVVTGYSKHFKSKEVYFDYNSGAELINDNGQFIQMP